MAPFYRGYDPVFKLDSDDIQGIQALYGRKTSGVSPGGPTSAKTTKKPTVLKDDDILCKDSKIDAIFNTADGNTYALKGDKYYRLTENSVAEGYPKPITEGWPGLPSNIDAAFTYKNGKTYFFKGSKYWRYNGRQLDGEYPKEISEGFAGIPNDLDAALVWGGNGKIYFYRGSKFWRFDPLKRPPVKSTYPKPISNWEGIPNDIDAALQYTNGYTYFFKGDKYYRFNDRTFSVDQADPPFPRPTNHWWFGCANSPSLFSGNLIEPESNQSSDQIDDDFDAGGTDERPAHDSKYSGNNSSNRHQSFLGLILIPTVILTIINRITKC
jgi:matrix metalloproteinase-14 (membrane-inserted)